MFKRNSLFCLTFLSATGIFLPSYIPLLLPSWLLICLVILSLYCFYRKCFLQLALILGLLYGGIYSHWITSSQLPKEWNNHHFILQGYIVDLPQKTESGYKFTFKITAIKPTKEGKESNKKASFLWGSFKGKNIALSWYHYPYKNAKTNSHGSNLSTTQFKGGEHWQFEVKLRRPRGFVNPHNFDYQLYLLQQKIVASGYIKTKSASTQLINAECERYKPICIRQSISTWINNNEELFYFHGLLLGLLIGDRQDISDQQWEILRDTGTVHLLAISGLHIGLAAVFGLVIGRFFQRLVTLLSSHFFSFYMTSTWRIPSLFSIIFSLFYSLLSGLTLPTQRALVMVVLFHFFVIVKRKVSPWLLLSSALFVIALINPLSIRSQGFWLSFLAVAVLLFVFNGYQFTNSKTANVFQVVSKLKLTLFSLFKAQWALSLGLFLPGIILIQGTSLSSSIANLIAIPLVSFITVPLLFIGLICFSIHDKLALIIVNMADISLQVLVEYLLYIQDIFGDFWYFDSGEVSLTTLFFACFGIIFMLLPRGIPYRYCGAIFLLPIFMSYSQNSDLEITFLDVGQGTSVLVITPNHQLIYDTGKAYSKRFTVGEHILAPLLMGLGHSKIDTVITSHGDSDHSGGLNGLLKKIAVAQHLSGEPVETGGEQCHAGQSWQWNQVSFSILWPTLEYLNLIGNTHNSNNRSCVLLIEMGEHRFLLSGDIEKNVEMQLLSMYPKRLKDVTVVLIPHHGSKTSSHQNWVRFLEAKYAVVTAGFTNAYGHPHPKVIDRYRGISQIEHTASSGAIRFTVNDNDLHLHRWRDFSSRYWYDQ